MNCENKSCVLTVDTFLQDLRESQTLSRTVSLGANLSDIQQPCRKLDPAYSFVGMHCIFDECKSIGKLLDGFVIGHFYR